MNKLNPTAALVLAAMAACAWALPAAAQVTFYENSDFGGRSFATQQSVGNFAQFGFNDRASSVVVERDRWELCEDADYSGRCVVLAPGRYSSLSAMGLNDRVSSVRLAEQAARGDDDRSRQPLPPPAFSGGDFRRRNSERLYQADVIAVHAVLGTPQQRCWVEREQVESGRGKANVGGAVLGAVLGGILGHQIGGGVGKDLATAGGAVAGGAVGANVGRDRGGSTGQDVQRCSDVPGSARTEYWDVTYSFRGQEHRMQMTKPPGATVTVNRQGEPRS